MFSLMRTVPNVLGIPNTQYNPLNTNLNVQLDADILNGGNTEEQIRETFFEVNKTNCLLF